MDGRRQGHLGIGDVEDPGHDKGCSPHDRGHEDPSARCTGLYGRGIVAGISNPLHGRDGKGARGDHIGDHTTAYGTHHSAADHGHLGRPSSYRPQEGEGEIEEEARCACGRQGHAKEHKSYKKVSQDPGRETDHPFGPHNVVPYYPDKFEALPVKEPRHVARKKGIGREGQYEKE